MVPVLCTTPPPAPAGTPLSVLVVVRTGESHAWAAGPPSLPCASATHRAARSADVVVLLRKNAELVAPSEAAHASSTSAPPTSRTSMWPAVLSEYLPARMARA